MRISVAGTGYVGLVTGVCLAEKGHTVVCVDPDQKKIDQLCSGIVPIYENGLEELMRKNSLRLRYTTDYRKAYDDAELIFICVGTPEKEDGSTDLEYVYSAAEQIALSVRNDCLVVIKSTVPIGTNDVIEEFIRSRLARQVKVEVASNPEFLAQGRGVRDTLYASRIVLGVASENAERILRTVYAQFKSSPVVVTNRKSAEMIKYAANDFLALKISYINEIANLCEASGADIEEVALGIGLDPRIGDKFLNAGIGYGGSCFPKDTKALHWFANSHHCELKTIKAAIEVNAKQKLKLLEKARKYYDSFADLSIAVLGLAFKPGTDDLREAPALQNISMLLQEDAKIKVWDPIAMNKFKKIYPTEIEYCSTIERTIKGADLCLIFTEWPQIQAIDPAIYPRLMRRPIVLDGRNCYDLDAVRGSTGLCYESIGREAVSGYMKSKSERSQTKKEVAV